MDELALLEDLHAGNPRQGPGSPGAMEMALALAGFSDAGGTRDGAPTPQLAQGDASLRVADIGCGTGAATLRLARLPGARVEAVDLMPRFLQRLQHDAVRAGVDDRVQACAADMGALPFQAGRFDLLWSEGAIYNLGFAAGIRAWRPFLREGGVLAVSEITWLTEDRPAELQDYWEKAYPEVATAGEKLRQLEVAGYSPLGYFPLPADCWLEHYYGPLEAGLPAFLERHGHGEAAAAIAAEERREIALYQEFGTYYSYGFYISRKI